MLKSGIFDPGFLALFKGENMTLPPKVRLNDDAEYVAKIRQALEKKG